MPKNRELFAEQIYCIDSSALINLHKYLPSTSKEGALRPMWDTIEDMCKEGRLISSVEVLRELHDEDIRIWCKKNSMQFRPVDEEQSALFEEIQKHYTQENFRKKTSSMGAWADPILIALSKVEPAILVTDENPASSNSIPFIAKKFEVVTRNLTGFLKDINHPL